MGLGGISVDIDRMEVVDFLRTYRFSPVIFVTRAPQIIDNSKLLITVFSKNLWIALSLLSIFICLFTKFIYHQKVFDIILCPFLKQSMNNKIILFRFKKSFCFCLIFLVIWNQIPKKFDFRIYMSSWMIFCLVMSTAYAALLSSSMSIPFLTPTIKTLSELAKANSEGRIKIIAHANSIYYQMIKVCIHICILYSIEKFLKRISCI